MSNAGVAIGPVEGDPATGRWHEVANTGPLDTYGSVGATIDGHPIAIFRVGQALHATDGLCTHALVPLEDGLLIGHEIECPVHQARFDVRTGACTAFPARRPLRVFPVRRCGDRVEVWLPHGLQRRARPDPPA